MPQSNRSNGKETDTPEGRRRRRDAGSILITQRDRNALRWIGEMMVVRLDQLQYILGGDAQRETQAPGVLAMSSVKDVVARWRNLGLVETKSVFAREPQLATLTHTGLQLVELPYRTWQGSLRDITHYLYTNWARIHLEKKFPSGRWTSERRMIFSGLKERDKRPDGIFTDNSDDFCVQVELTRKSIERTQRIMRSMAKEYDMVVYFVVRETHDFIRDAVEKLPKEVDKDTFEIISFEEDIGIRAGRYSPAD